MKTTPLALIAAGILLLSNFISHAQNIEDPGAYITAISNAQTEMRQKYMAYMSTVAHSHRARKIEKMRMATLESINNSKYKTSDIHIYKGDNSLRKSSIDYIDLCYRVFNDDYKHIVDMEEIAEQSFDEMQAYILLNEKTNEKIQEASDNMSKASKDFAKKYNVNLIETNDELGEKLSTANLLNNYRDKLYLIFFKCNWEDGEMVKAMNNKKVKDMEQARNSLTRYATEGLSGLDTLKTFQNDPALAVACRQTLDFYKKMAENDVPKLTEFYLKQEDFEKTKKAFERSEQNKQQVDAYNKSVKDINSAANNYNQVNNNINNNRKQVLQNWDDAEKAFANDHMPHYK